MKARIYFSIAVLTLLALVLGWWWLVDRLPIPTPARLAIFFLAPALGAFVYPKKTEKQ